jgi:predicted dinucleotide-binding enzyme
MKIGIIGAGHIGGTLTRRLRQLGHDVSVANSRGPETLSSLAQETGAHPVTVEEAARDKDVVIDTGNYYPRQRDGRIDAIESGTTESRWVAQQLGRPVVKAFNNIYAKHLLERGKPKGAPDRIALPVAGDDRRAKETVMRLIDELGFDPVDAGGLDDSWRQQPGTPVYGTDKDAEGVRRALDSASSQRPAEFTGTAGALGA